MNLTDVKIRQAKPAEKTYRLPDGAGLHLEIRPNGSKLWRYRYRLGGKENLFAIGRYPETDLKAARKAREEAREMVEKGLHPAKVRKARLAVAVAETGTTMEGVTREWIDRRGSGWTGPYRQKVISHMEADVFPMIGTLPVRDVRAPHLLPVLQMVEDRGAPTTAILIRQWCSQVFRYAVATGRADMDPAAALQGVITRARVNHANPMTWESLGTFMGRVQAYNGSTLTKIALKLLAYCWVRTIEVRRMEPGDVDLKARLWTIPAAKMKMRRDHVVPLSRQAADLIAELRTITGAAGWAFPNLHRPDDVMSATTLNRALERMGYAGGLLTCHDFRATASTRLHEMGYRSELIERQLAHVEKSKTRAAYNHAEYLDERREMMQTWADRVDQAAGVTRAASA